MSCLHHSVCLKNYFSYASGNRGEKEDKWIQKFKTLSAVLLLFLLNNMALLWFDLDATIMSSLVWKILCVREEISFFFCHGRRPDVPFITQPILLLPPLQCDWLIFRLRRLDVADSQDVDRVETRRAVPPSTFFLGLSDVNLKCSSVMFPAAPLGKVAAHPSSSGLVT